MRFRRILRRTRRARRRRRRLPRSAENSLGPSRNPTPDRFYLLLPRLTTRSIVVAAGSALPHLRLWEMTTPAFCREWRRVTFPTRQWARPIARLAANSRVPSTLGTAQTGLSALGSTVHV